MNEEIKELYMSTIFSNHATLRMSQRNFTERDVSYILKFGLLKYQTGIRFYFVSKKCVPASDLRLPWVQRLIGTALLVNSGSNGDVIITLYKNQNALKQIKRKNKHRSLVRSNQFY